MKAVCFRSRRSEAKDLSEARVRREMLRLAQHDRGEVGAVKGITMLDVGHLTRRRLLAAVPMPFLAACGASTGGGSAPATKSEYVVAPLQGAFGDLATDL